MIVEARLTTGLSVQIITSLDEQQFQVALQEGWTFKDRKGWNVMPSHVVLWRRLEEYD